MIGWLLDSLPTQHLSLLGVSLSCYLCIIPLRRCAFLLLMHAVEDETDGEESGGDQNLGGLYDYMMWH
jgi:hypothetical protein